MKLVGERVSVELKNGTVAEGVVVGVTASMNILLKAVKMTVRMRDPVEMEHLVVRGSTVRNVIMPDSVNLDVMLADGLGRVKRVEKTRAGRGGRGGRGRGRGRGHI